MIYESLAIITAFLYASSSIFSKKGLSGSNALSATFVSAITNFVIIWIVYVSDPTSVFSSKAVLLFALGGILSSFVGRTCLFISIEKVGVSVTSSIVGSSPVFATIAASALLNERFGILTYCGIIVVVSGIVLLSQKGTEGKIAWKRIEIVWPLMASVCYGTSITVRKIGLNIVDHPMLGAVIGISASLGFNLLTLILSQRVKPMLSTLNKRSLVFFLFSGICTSVAWITSYTATSKGPATLVSSLQATYPLFTLLLSVAFLREKITRKLLTGSIMIIMGVILITIF